MTSKRRIIGAGALLACSLAPDQAQAQGETKFEVDFRTGYGIPIGKAVADATDDLSEVIAGQIPLWIDLGARIRERVFVGAYFSYGFGILGGEVSDACDEAEEVVAALGGRYSCSTSDLRLGVQALYHFGPPNEMHAWLGGGIGYEWWSFSQSVEVGGRSATLGITAHGFELLNLQFGGDFPLTQGFALGPFVAFTLAQFGTVSGDCSGDCTGVTTSSESIDDKSTHHWLFLGVRGALLP